MKRELTVYELGKLLKEITEKTKVELLVKRKLSGGFITIKGETRVLNAPTEQKTLKGNNIISLSVKNKENGEMVIKLTGIKNSKFSVEVAPTRYKEINIGGLSMDKIKESDEEGKVKIDEDLIFTVHESSREIEKLLEE